MTAPNVQPGWTPLARYPGCNPRHDRRTPRQERQLARTRARDWLAARAALRAAYQGTPFAPTYEAARTTQRIWRAFARLTTTTYRGRNALIEYTPRHRA